jgi:N-acetylglucosaminyl-diphospho-decaprenol L-rhamnosyltransferase
MSSSPRLSIVVPSHDSRELTLECLGSLASGGVRELEVWVVDDASEDGTAAAIERRFPEVCVVRSDHRRGFTVSANRGLDRARADLLLLLNSDTEIRPGSLRALVEVFERDPTLGVGGGNLHYPDGSPQWSGGREPSLLWLFALASGLPRLVERLPGYRRLRPLEPISSDPTPVDWVTGAALALRKDVWNQIRPLDVRFRFYCQDLDFCRRAAREGWKIALVPVFRVLHHHGATIGRAAGAHRGRQHPELLWTDLVRWAEKHHGVKWARRAHRTLSAGARMRLAGRNLASLFIPVSAKPAWRRDSEAFRLALATLRRFPLEVLP